MSSGILVAVCYVFLCFLCPFLTLSWHKVGSPTSNSHKAARLLRPSCGVVQCSAQCRVRGMDGTVGHSTALWGYVHCLTLQWRVAQGSPVQYSAFGILLIDRSSLTDSNCDLGEDSQLNHSRLQNIHSGMNLFVSKKHAVNCSSLFWM